MYGTNLRKTRSLQICEQKEQRATMIYKAVRGMDMVCDSLSCDLQEEKDLRNISWEPSNYT